MTMPDPMSALAQSKDFRARRISKCGFAVQLAGIETLAQINGAGEIAHIWLAVDCAAEHFLRKFLVRMYWDGEPTPSVEVPLGDFFGVGHARNTPYQCAAMNVISRHEHPGSPSGHGFVANVFYPMPFGQGARIELVTDGVQPGAKAYAFYFQVDYRELPAAPGPLRFHAQWRRQNPTRGLPITPQNVDRPEENYVALEASGAGHLAGCNLSIDSLEDGWWCTGGDAIYVDGEPHPPAIKGIGLEDYIGHGWGVYDQAGPYAGCSVFDRTFAPGVKWRSQWTVYRHYVVDPIPFSQSIKVTFAHGGVNERSDDYSSTTYWYQAEPHAPFPRMLPQEDRLPRPQ